MSRVSLQSIKRFFPLLLGALLFGLGIYALQRLLHSVDPADIAAQVRATPGSTLALALAATAIAYLALIFYDWFALRFIGRRLAPGIVAIGGFLGYAFGNTIGVSLVSGGAVRYRIYSAVGLNAFEVAAVSGYIAMALGTGLTLIGLAALAIHPVAVAAYLPYPETTVRTLAGAAVLGSAAVILWVSATGRRIGFRSYDLRLPPPGDLAGQLAVTLIDVVAAAFALWVLLPAGKPEFATFVAVYATAMMVGVLSHVPGGIGVFETVVIGTLPASVPIGDAAAALLLFRVIYYLLPFGLGFLLVALNEAWMAGGLAGRLLARLPAPVQPAVATLHGIAPSLVASVTFGFGAYLLLVTMIPAVRSDALAEGDLVAALLLEGGTLGAAIAGVTLLILSHGLARRVSSAYWLAILTIAMAVGAALLNNFDTENAALLTLGGLSLLPFRRAFDRQGPLTQGVFEARWFALVLAVGLATAAFFFLVHRTVPYSNDLWAELSARSGTPRALRAVLAASAVVFFFSIHLMTRPVQRRVPLDTGAEALARAATLAAASEDPQGWLSQSGDKRFLFSETGRSFIMYAVHRRSWIALGDPVGDPAEFEALAWSFWDVANRANCRPIFYEVSARHLATWVDLGCAVHKIGEEAVVRLAGFSLSGAPFKAMRAAMHKHEREGFTFEILPPPHDAERIAELGAVSEAWLGGKTGHEKRFAVGRFDADYLGRFDLAVIRSGGQVVAFANILCSDAGRHLAVDLMRYLPDEASGLMEYLFLRLIEHYQRAGGEEFSLGMAPLAGLSERSIGRTWNRFGRLIYRHGGAFYNFEGLRAFKQKFHPEWRPRYLAVPPNLSPLVAMRDVALLIAGSPRGLIAK
jgi:phosphatidylglycerol lysyltransferase